MSKLQLGPIDGHWMEAIQLVKSKDDGKAFECQVCIREGKTSNHAVFRSSGSESNMYAHFKCKHVTAYSALSPLIDSRKNNKRSCIQNQGTIKLSTFEKQ